MNRQEQIQERIKELIIQAHLEEQSTVAEIKERIGERGNQERKDCIERYLELYRKGRINEEDLIAALSE